MRSQAVPILIASLLLAACATPDPAVERGWVGATYDEVIAQWGDPVDGSTLEDGTDVRLWVAEQAAPQPSSTIGFGIGGGRGHVGTGVGMSIPIGPPPPPRRCERRLYFKGGYVVDEEWMGDSGVCAAFRRRA
jgi:hypothetical protein